MPLSRNSFYYFKIKKLSEICRDLREIDESDESLPFDSVKRMGNPADRVIELYFKLENGQRQSMKKTLSWVILRPYILRAVKSKNHLLPLKTI